MHDRGSLTRSIRVDLGRTLLVIVEAQIRPFRCEAGDARQALGAADGLNVLIQDLIGRGHTETLRQNLVGL